MLENNHEKKPKKYAGILAHPTSFPSPYGIGDLGKGAYRFIDFLGKFGLESVAGTSPGTYRIR